MEFPEEEPIDLSEDDLILIALTSEEMIYQQQQMLANQNAEMARCQSPEHVDGPRTENASGPGMDNASGLGTENARGPSRESASDPSTESASDPSRESASDPSTESASDPSRESASDPSRESASDPSRESASDPSRESASDPSRENVADHSTATTSNEVAGLQVDQGPGTDADGGAQAAAQTPSENLPEKTDMSKSQDEVPHELENQFILRVPPEYASTIRKMVRSRDVAMKDKLKIDLSPDGRRATVEVDKVSLAAKLVDLPCVVGSMKTFDKKTFFTTADISQMLVCTTADDQPQSSPEEPVASADLDLMDISEREKKKSYTWKHGITPPLKNVRKKRFRKTTKKLADLKELEEISFSEYVDSPAVEKEVKRLLYSDAEAISARWEVIAEGEDKEIESQGCISGFKISPGSSGEKRGRISSEYNILREMFSFSIDNEEEEETSSTKKDEDEDEEEEDEEDEDEDMIEEEEETDCEEDLERELQAKLLESNLYKSKEASNALVLTIQKQIHFLERKLRNIQCQTQRQNHLFMKVESLPLKNHLKSVLEKLNLEEKQRNEQLISLQEKLKCILKK
ncbi:transcription initiation factor TFIID subunit 7-like isoform X1 [Oryctolagus cuniculus]|uniref:transcription initiation factor TFIID subunit 7-like isoform X1 n=2 Tax=Oryctolagus cuniculus TaxID=9986 RepID=UPI0038791B8D